MEKQLKQSAYFLFCQALLVVYYVCLLLSLPQKSDQTEGWVTTGLIVWLLVFLAVVLFHSGDVSLSRCKQLL